MKAKIKGKVFNVVEGATFSEEYNEKLDSGAIIISQVEKQKFKPYDDVFVYNDDANFVGISSTQIKYEEKVETTRTTPIYANEREEDIVNTTTIGGGTLGIRIFGDGIFGYLIYLLHYTSDIEEYCPYDFNNNLILTFNGENLVEGSGLGSSVSMQVSRDHYSANTTNISFVVSGTYYSLSAMIDEENSVINFGVSPYIIDSRTGERLFRVSSFSIVEGRNTYTIRDVSINNVFHITMNDESIYNYLIEGQEIHITINDKYSDGSVSTSTTQGIVNEAGQLQFSRSGFSFVRIRNTNVYALSQTIPITSNFLVERSLSNFYLLIDNNEGFEKPSFYRHLLIDSVSEERINLVENLYKYKITLMSETKRLEKIQCPNLSITQPLKFSKKKSIYQYLIQYLELFNPKIKIATRGGANTWFYAPKYKLSPRLETKFSKVIAPDFSLNNPTFRDLLNQLMIVGDCIPIVKDNVIDYLDLTKRKGVFNVEGTNYFENSLSSEDYTNNLKKNYNEGLSINNARYIEKLGFRNSENGLMTIENMRIETRYPIYKINKIYMCYYKKYAVYINDTTSQQNYIMLVKQDITPLVKLNSERNLLSTDWLDLAQTKPSNIEDASQYKLMTIGYDLGSNLITGWGTIYSYPIQNSWYDTTKSYIENIVSYMDSTYPFGINNGETIKQIAENGTMVSVVGDWQDTIVVPDTPNTLQTSDPLKLKCLFFEIDYNAFYNGTIIHSKDNNFGDLVDNDNPSSSLTLLESDGNFEKEKINRVGNTIYQINARYKSVDEIQELGSVYEDDNIIYHREYSIYQHFVKCNYYATKDYVMKNYFTSVWAKHRTYNLLGYDESIVRAENKKVFLYLSSDEIYNEIHNSLEFENFENNNPLYLLASAFVPNAILTSVNDYVLNDNINAGYLENNFSDVNTFVSGTSLIFNVKMFDNVSGGVKINQIAPDAGIIDANDEYTKGSTQQWLLSVDDIETGQIENISVNVVHLDNSDLFLETPFIFDNSKINNVYQNILYNLPQTSGMLDNAINIIKWQGNIYKDNKEQLDFTFQIEPITRDKNVAFNGNFMLLNNLVNYIYKNDINYSLADTSLVQNDILMYYSSFNTGQDYGVYILGTICVNIPTNKSIEDISQISFTYNYNVSYSKDALSWNAYLTVNNIKIKEVHSDYIVCEIATMLQRYDFNVFNHKITLKEVIGQETITMNLYRYNYNQTFNGYYERKPIQDKEGYQSFGNTLQIGVYNNKYGIEISSINAGSRFDGLTYMDDEHNEYNYGTNLSAINYDIHKNIFVFYRKNGTIEDSKLMGKGLPDETNLFSTELLVSDIFTIEENEVNYNSILIDIREVEMGTADTIKTLEYWYYDEKEECYKFVFGVNMYGEDIFKEKNDTYKIEFLNNSVNIYYGERVIYLDYVDDIENITSMTLNFYDREGNFLEEETFQITKDTIDLNEKTNVSYFSIKEIIGNNINYTKLNVYRITKRKRIYLSLLSNNVFEVYDNNLIECGSILNYYNSGEQINNYQLMKKNV